MSVDTSATPQPEQPNGSTSTTASDWKSAVEQLVDMCDQVMTADYSQLDLIERTDTFEMAQRCLAGLAVIIQQQRRQMQDMRLELAMSRLRESSEVGPKILRFESLEALGKFLADEADKREASQ